MPEKQQERAARAAELAADRLPPWRADLSPMRRRSRPGSPSGMLLRDAVDKDIDEWVADTLAVDPWRGGVARARITVELLPDQPNAGTTTAKQPVELHVVSDPVFPGMADTRGG